MRPQLPLAIALACALAAPSARPMPIHDPTPPKKAKKDDKKAKPKKDLRSPDAKDAERKAKPVLGPPAPKFPLTLKKAIADYAPVLWLHKDEQYLPTSAEKFLAVSKPSGSGRRLKDTSSSRRGDLGAAKTYVHLKVGDRHSEIQYWFLYAYNGPGTAYFKVLKPTLHYQGLPDASLDPCGRHEGDWESIFVRVDNATGKMVNAYLNQHEGGQQVSPGQIVHGGRVTVFASKNGHATYPGEGRNYSETKKLVTVEFRLVNDANRGRAWDTRKDVQLISVHDLRGANRVASHADALKFYGAKEPGWMSIRGNWGLVEKFTRSDVKNAMKKALGGTGAGILDKIGGDAVIDKIIDAGGFQQRCLGTEGPTPPWSKPSWLSKSF